MLRAPRFCFRGRLPILPGEQSRLYRGETGQKTEVFKTNVTYCAATTESCPDAQGQQAAVEGGTGDRNHQHLEPAAPPLELCPLHLRANTG